METKKFVTYTRDKEGYPKETKTFPISDDGKYVVINDFLKFPYFEGFDAKDYLIEDQSITYYALDSEALRIMIESGRTTEDARRKIMRDTCLHYGEIVKMVRLNTKKEDGDKVIAHLRGIHHCFVDKLMPLYNFVFDAARSSGVKVNVVVGGGGDTSVTKDIALADLSK